MNCKKLYCFGRFGMVLLATTVLSFPQAVFASAKKPAAPVSSSKNMGIAAVVGGDAISSYDVDNRIRFIIATARLSNTPDVIDKIRPQVVQSLIDEKLKSQEAEKNNISISQAEIDQAIAAIEDQRGMPRDTIFHILDGANVPRDTFTQQIRAQLFWNQLLNKKIRPQVHITEEEIAQAGHRFVPVHKKETPVDAPDELKISVITLPVDKPSRRHEIKRLAEKLVKEVRGGANFEEVSRQFSSVTASSGGKVEAFWIKLTQLDPNIARVLSTVPVGSVTSPLPSSEGFTIIKVYDVRGNTKKAAPEKVEKAPEPKARVTEVSMKEILLKVKPDADSKEAEAMLKVGEDVAKNPGTCESKDLGKLKNQGQYDIDVSFRTQPMADLPPAIKIIAENLAVGDISTPFASNEGIRLFMLCSKKEVDAKPVDRDEVFHMLLQQKMELESQKYIRNLRREIFVDIR